MYSANASPGTFKYHIAMYEAPRLKLQHRRDVEQLHLLVKAIEQGSGKALRQTFTASRIS